MKLNDIRELSRDDILAALGLASRPTSSERLLGTLGIFSVGLLVGAGVALLLAPKSGRALRDDLGERLRSDRNDGSDSADPSAPESAGEEART
jgi:gas vesicle protein